MKSAEFSCGRLRLGMEKNIKQKKKEKNTENIKKEVAVGKGVVGYGPQAVLSGARESADDCLAMKNGLRRSDSAFSSSGAGKISRVKARRAIGRTFPLFIVYMLFCMSFAMTVTFAAGSDLEPSQLEAWEKLYDLMPSGGCPGTCTSRDDPCSCSSTTYVKCSADGKYLTYLDLGSCSMQGK